MKNKKTQLIFACVIGNILEWYDFALYSVFSVVLAKTFFPSDNTQLALVNAFIVFAIGYFLRPLGGIILGHLGDRYSRRKVLMISLLMMGLSSSLMGFLPSYATIGIASPIIFIGLRIIQGLALGGEFPASMVTLIENTPSPKLTSLMGTLPFVGAIIGFLSATALANLILNASSDIFVKTYGWRILFILGLGIAYVGWLIRSKFYQENSKKIVEKAPIPFLTVIQKKPKLLGFNILILSTSAIFQGFLVVYLPTYLDTSLHFAQQSIFNIYLMVNLLLTLFMPLGAYLADKITTRYHWLLIGYTLLLLAIFPLFYLLETGTWGIVLALCLISALFSCAAGPLISSVVLSFPESLRCTGVALAHGLTFSILIGTAPLVFLKLTHSFGVLAPVSYLSLITLISILGLIWKLKNSNTFTIAGVLKPGVTPQPN